MKTASIIGPGYNLRSKGPGGYNLRSTSRRSLSSSSSKSKVKKLKNSPNKIRAKPKSDLVVQKTHLANLALQHYNSAEGSNFKHVKNGYIGGALISIGIVRHLTFKGKDQDDPQARMKTFFAEVITRGRIEDDRVSVIKCLGETVPLPEYGNDYGCDLCYPGVVYHPSDVEFINGKDY